MIAITMIIFMIICAGIIIFILYKAIVHPFIVTDELDKILNQQVNNDNYDDMVDKSTDDNESKIIQ